MSVFPTIEDLRARRKKYRWYREKATESQRRMLTKIGTTEALLATQRSDLKRGEASDIIGNSRPCSNEVADILRYFTFDPMEFTENDGNELVEWLRGDKDLWLYYENRPLTPEEQDYFRLMKLPEPEIPSVARQFLDNAAASDRLWKRFEKRQYDEADRIEKIVFEVDEVIGNFAYVAEEVGIYFDPDQEITLDDKSNNFVLDRIRLGKSCGHQIALFQYLLDRLNVVIEGDIETLYKLAKQPRLHCRLIKIMSPG